MNEQDRVFFTSEEAKPIQKGWVPKFGDLVWASAFGLAVLIVEDGSRPGWYWVEAAPEHRPSVTGWYPKGGLILLPHQGQLRKMLEERGYTVCLTGPYMLPKNYQAILAKEDEEAIVEYGPTPSIALGKCLLEVLGAKAK